MLEERFFRILFGRMSNIELLMPVIDSAAEMVVNAVTHGGRFVVYDENGQMNGESSYRCSGLRLPFSGVGEDGGLIDVTAKDVVIVYSLLPATERSMTALEKARVSGCYTIVVCPKTRGEHEPEHATLAQMAHVHIDNLSDADGVVRPSGWKNTVAPTTAIMNDVLLWCLHGRIIDLMMMRGMTPGVLRGSHLRGGRNYNRAFVDSLFTERGW